MTTRLLPRRRQPTTDKHKGPRRRDIANEKEDDVPEALLEKSKIAGTSSEAPEMGGMLKATTPFDAGFTGACSGLRRHCAGRQRLRQVLLRVG